jgi:hypothetical protein
MKLDEGVQKSDLTNPVILPLPVNSCDADSNLDVALVNMPSRLLVGMRLPAKFFR